MRFARREPLGGRAALGGGDQAFSVKAGTHVRCWALAATANMALSVAAGAQPVAAPSGPGDAPAPAAAREAGSSGSAAPAGGVDEIVVTAQKREQRLSDVPESITAVSGPQLLAQGINDVEGLVKVTPGLSFVDSGRSIPVFSIRGVGFFDTSLGARPTVSVYLDEAPIPFSVEALGAGFDLERVEVLKGPQGTLFGQNSTGGAINYIAAKPGRSFVAGGTASVDNFGQGDVQAYVGGPITSTLSARLAVRTVHGGDYQESYTRDASLGSQDFTQARLILAWTPTDRLSISLNANGFFDGSDTRAAQFRQFLPTTPSRAYLLPLLQNYPPAPRTTRAADWNPGEDYASDNGFYQFVTRADYRVTDSLTLTSLTTYSHESIGQLVDADGTDVSNYDANVRGGLSTFSEEVRATGHAAQLQYIVGASYERDRTRENDIDNLSYSTTAYAIAPPPYPALDVFGVLNRQNFDTAAVFGNVDYSVTDKLVLHGGLRFTQANLNYAACTTGYTASAAAAYTGLVNALHRAAGLAAITPLQAGQCISLNGLTPGQAAGQLDQNNVSWRTGIDYKLFPHTLLYFNASKGYKAGSTQTSTSNSNLQYQPVTQESVQAYEGGVKSTLLDRKLEVAGAIFHYDYTNKQVLGRQVFTPNIFGPLGALINIPQAESTGAEMQATAYPVRGLTLTLGGTWLYTKVDGDFLNYSILGARANFKGDPFPYTPKYEVVFTGDYRFPQTRFGVAFLGANVTYRTRTSSGFGDEPLLAIPSYVLLDLRAGLESPDGRWRAELFGRNVTDSYDVTNVARSQDSLRAYVGRPATYGLQVSYRY